VVLKQLYCTLIQTPGILFRQVTSFINFHTPFSGDKYYVSSTTRQVNVARDQTNEGTVIMTVLPEEKYTDSKLRLLKFRKNMKINNTAKSK